jgi:2'-5' RNA ligase
MFLSEIKKHTFKRPVETDPEYGIEGGGGRYIGLHFTPETKERIKKIIHDEGIPEPTPEDKFHTTIAYSKDNSIPDYKVAGRMDNPIDAKIDSFDIFPSQDGRNCLIAKLDCPECVNLHKKTRDMGASYDYDDYIPHVTLSYNAGDYSPEQLDMLSQKYKGFPIVADEEYDEPLNDEWVKNL